MLLGPPRDEAMLKKTFVANEVYHLAANDAGHNAFFGAAALGGSAQPTIAINGARSTTPMAANCVIRSRAGI